MEDKDSKEKIKNVGTEAVDELFGVIKKFVGGATNVMFDILNKKSKEVIQKGDKNVNKETEDKK